MLNIYLRLILCKFHQQPFYKSRIYMIQASQIVKNPCPFTPNLSLLRFQTTHVKSQAKKQTKRKKKRPKELYLDLIQVLDKYQKNLMLPGASSSAFKLLDKSVSKPKYDHYKKTKKSKNKSKSLIPALEGVDVFQPINETINEVSVNTVPNSEKNKLKKKQKSNSNINNNKLARESVFFASLRSYIDVCLHVNMHKEAHNILKSFDLEANSDNTSLLVDSGVFEIMIQGWATKGNLEMQKELITSLKVNGQKLGLRIFAAWLECLSRQPCINMKEASIVLDELHAEGHSLQDIFDKCKFVRDQREKISSLVNELLPGFRYQPPRFPSKYSCSLAQELNKQPDVRKLCPSVENLFTPDELHKFAQEQFDYEKISQINVKNIARKSEISDNMKFMRKQLELCEKEWRILLKHCFLQNLEGLWNKVKYSRNLSMYPYLTVLDPDVYVDIMMQEIKTLSESSEAFSPGINFVSRLLGLQVMMRYMTWVKKEYGIADKIHTIYQKYLTHLTDPEYGSPYTPRDIFSDLVTKYSEGPSIDVAFIYWPSNVLTGVGRFLHNIIIQEVKISPYTIFKHKIQSRKKYPAFYKIFRRNGLMLKEEVKTHPLICKLYKGAESDFLHFNVSMVPMVCPPLPWLSAVCGGFLITPTELVRQSANQFLIESQCPVRNLYPSLDSLNVLGICPWVINKPVLDLIIELFNKNGNKELNVPEPPSVLTKPVRILSENTKMEKAKLNYEKLVYKQKRAEMYSLWCDALYKLSIANHFRDRVFWFPHNMDFRGRVYPTPPHFNHLGSDLVRSILLFAKGQPLGENGLDWLKVHLINLTGTKKRSSIAERLSYANEILPDILDSADNPFNGSKWWMGSDEPWQTLACCREVANAVRSPDPAQYISHFPVHQDGSCNGLQHYAALGRDIEGAQQVNLHPSILPQDVYTGVANLVEEQRAFDARNGVVIASALEGFITRKVVKQTVMTIVYGVTRFGARLQILKQLEDLKGFPDEHSWAASHYLVQKTFFSIEKMFTATRLIQDWFTECARLISKVRGEPVSWVTPLGFPVMQPYQKKLSTKSNIVKPFNRVSFISGQPNVLKQKNAFPPNFIHSLDSCHMMLTSLFCQREGIVFVSVHDCFWTHANTVDVMNSICREQFVALHNEPILENLSKYLVEKFAYSDLELNQNLVPSVGKMKKDLNKVLVKIPATGNFELESVLRSTYFFS